MAKQQKKQKKKQKKTIAEQKRVIVERGEQTGHAHVATGRDVQMLTTAERRILEAPDGAVLTHEEHGTLDLPAGSYRVVRIQEYDYDAHEARAVVD